MSDKAMQAAHGAVANLTEQAAESVVRAYFSALAEDPEAIEAVSRVLREQHHVVAYPVSHSRAVLAALRDRA